MVYFWMVNNFFFAKESNKLLLVCTWSISHIELQPVLQLPLSTFLCSCFWDFKFNTCHHGCWYMQHWWLTRHINKTDNYNNSKFEHMISANGFYIQWPSRVQQLQELLWHCWADNKWKKTVQSSQASYDYLTDTCCQFILVTIT